MKNTYKVPVKQWRKWSELGRRIFNETFRAMTDNPECYWHPMAARITKRLWRTTAWNAAWIAADVERTVKVKT